jgi:hypothetical protein
LKLLYCIDERLPNPPKHDCKNAHPKIFNDGRTQSAPTCLFFFFQQILVLTLGSPLEKGGRKKNRGINPGQPAGKGRKRKKKKTRVINPGQPARKG